MYLLAFEKTKPARDALSPEKLVRTNVDILFASNTAQMAYPGMVLYRPAIGESFKDFDFTQFDSIPDYALAAVQAQTEYENMPYGGELPALYAEVQTLRERFRADLAGVVNRKILDETSIDDLTSAVGYENVGHSVLRLASFAQKHASSIAGKTPLTPAELATAKNTVNRMMLAARAREAAGTLQQEAADVRQRALTLLILAYDAARDAIGYVRRKESDIASIAPTLYITRGKKKADDTTTPTPITDPVTTPVTTGATPTPAPVIALPITAPPTNAIAPAPSPTPIPKATDDEPSNVFPLMKKSA